jgi:hypothetical protein
LQVILRSYPAWGRSEAAHFVSFVATVVAAAAAAAAVVAASAAADTVGVFVFVFFLIFVIHLGPGQRVAVGL